MNKHVHSKAVPAVLLAAVLAFAPVLAGCAQPGTPQAPEPAAGSEVGSAAGSEAATPDTPPATTTPDQPEEENVPLYLYIDDQPVRVSWEDNASTAALYDLAKNSPDGQLTVHMERYGGFEQVGSLGTTIPSQNVQTDTYPGHIVLYQGNQIVIFFGEHSWSYTYLGRLHFKNTNTLRELLDTPTVEVGLSVEEPEAYNELSPESFSRASEQPEQPATTSEPTTDQAPSQSSDASEIPPDPLDFDYESAEDYADDTYTWFAQHGYDDPYGAALRYYEDNGPL